MKNRGLLVGAIIGACAVIVIAVIAFSGFGRQGAESASNEASSGQDMQTNLAQGESGAAASDEPESDEVYVWAVSKTYQIYSDDHQIEVANRYDDSGRLVSSKYTSNSEEEAEMIGLGEKFEYDSSGRLVSVQTMFPDDDELYNKKAYKYDDNGRCIEYLEVDDWEGDMGTLTTYTYNDKGLLASAVCKGDSSQVASGLVDTVYQYTYSFTDDKGLQGSVEEKGEPVIDAGSEDEYGDTDDYDDGFDKPQDALYRIVDGRVIYEEEEDTSFKYDDYGNLIEESFDSSDTGSYKVRHEYKKIKVNKKTYVPNIYTNPTARTYERCSHIPPVLNEDEVQKIFDAATQTADGS